MKKGKLAELLNTPAGAVIAVGMLTIMVELLITMLIENVFPLSMHNFLYLFDPILLIAIVSPALYFLVFRPMRKQQAELEDARRRIGQAFQEWIAALDAVNDPIFLHGKDFRILRCNKAYQQCAGLPFKKIIGQPYYEVFPKADLPLPSCLHAMEKAEEEEEEEEEEEVTIGEATYRSRAYSIHDEQGAYLYSIHILEDITESKRAEAIRTRLMEHLESSPDFVGFADANDAHIFYINHAGRAMTGIGEDEDVTKLKVADLHPAWANRMLDEVILPAAVRTGGWQGECAFLHRDGYEIPVSMVLRAHKSANGAIDVFSTTSRDITERKQAEQALSESEKLYRSLFENMLNGFAYCQMIFEQDQPQDFIYLGVNAVFETLTGLKNVVGKRVSEVIPGIRQSDAKLFEIYGRVSLSGKPERFEIYVEALQQWFWISVYSPKTGYFVAVFDVITERKQAEEALRESKELLQSVLENAPIRVFWKDRDSRYLGCNTQFAKDAGHAEPDDLTGKTDFDMGWKDQAELYRADDKAVMESGIPKLDFEEPSTTPDGNMIWLRTSKVPLRDESNRVIGILGIYEDITEHKQAEIAIQHANRALATLSAVNRNLVRATNEDELLQAICDAIVGQRGYRLAWVGYKQHDESKSIRIMARAGHDEGYLDTMQISWAETERGMGPSGYAIRSGATQLCQDIANDPLFLPWRDAALQRGYATCIALPLLNEDGMAFGILHVYSAQVNDFTPSEVALLEEMAGDLAFGVLTMHTRHERDLAQEKIRQQLVQLQDSLEDTVRAMAGLVEMRDPYTAGHQARVANLAAAIARQMGLPDEQVHAIHIAGTVHDLGKINVPAEILSKPGKITDIDFNLIKTHPQAGYDILQGIDFPWPIAQMVLQHHERLDGSGYPQGLKGEAILLEARILAVADTVEAMSAHRPYRPGMGVEVALEEITKRRGVCYDPQVVDACLCAIREKGFVFAR